MPHIVLIDDCYPINSRNRKILCSLKSHYREDVTLSVITWDRDNNRTESPKGYHIYKKVSQYGNKTRKLLNLLGYRRFCYDTIHRLNSDVIIASHWNNLMMVPRLDRSQQMLVYENLDVPTEACILKKITTAIEHWHLRRVDLIIHASRFFPQLYSPKKKQLILENKPTFRVADSQALEYHLHQPLRIAFIGALRYRETLRILIDTVRDDKRFQLYFHGDGHARQFLKEYSSGASNVFFTGRYKYEDVEKLYQQTDILWAAYPNKDFNVKYAISNKFHESLAFGIPTVYANDTYLGDFVVENKIGMSVNPYSVESIKRLFEHIIDYQDSIQEMSIRMRAFGRNQTTWDEDFQDVTQAIDSFISV